MKDEQLREVEEQQEKLVKQNRRIDEELTELREHMQFNEKRTGMILSHSRLLRVELTKREEQVRNLQQQNERFKSLEQTEMLQAELRKNEQILAAQRKEVECAKKNWIASESKLAAAYGETHELRGQVAGIQSRFDLVSKELERVCSKREKLKELLQKHEKEVDQKMLLCMSEKPPEQEEVCVTQIKECMKTIRSTRTHTSVWYVYLCHNNIIIVDNTEIKIKIIWLYHRSIRWANSFLTDKTLLTVQLWSSFKSKSLFWSSLSVI